MSLIWKQYDFEQGAYYDPNTGEDLQSIDGLSNSGSERFEHRGNVYPDLGNIEPVFRVERRDPPKLLIADETGWIPGGEVVEDPLGELKQNYGFPAGTILDPETGLPILPEE